MHNKKIPEYISHRRTSQTNNIDNTEYHGKNENYPILTTINGMPKYLLFKIITVSKVFWVKKAQNR